MNCMVCELQIKDAVTKNRDLKMFGIKDTHKLSLKVIKAELKSLEKKRKINLPITLVTTVSRHYVHL